MQLNFITVVFTFIISFTSILEAKWCNETIIRDAVRIVDYFEEVTRHRDTFKCRFRFMKYSKKCTYKENIPRQRSETYQVGSISPKCCPEYEKYENPLRCEPICTPECINGRCMEGNKCECLDNFMRSQGLSHECVDCDCPNGFCSRGECHCKDGYERRTSEGLCQPQCNVDCLSGHCSVPNICDEVPTEADFNQITSSTVSEIIKEEPETTTFTTTLNDSSVDDDPSTTYSDIYSSESDFSSSTLEPVTVFESSSVTSVASSTTKETEFITDWSVVQDTSREMEDMIDMGLNETFSTTQDYNLNVQPSKRYDMGTLLTIWIVVGVLILTLLVLVFIVFYKLVLRTKVVQISEVDNELSVQYFSDSTFKFTSL